MLKVTRVQTSDSTHTWWKTYDHLQFNKEHLICFSGCNHCVSHYFLTSPAHSPPQRPLSFILCPSFSHSSFPSSTDRIMEKGKRKWTQGATAKERECHFQRSNYLQSQYLPQNEFFPTETENSDEKTFVVAGGFLGSEVCPKSKSASFLHYIFPPRTAVR